MSTLVQNSLLILCVGRLSVNKSQNDCYSQEKQHEPRQAILLMAMVSFFFLFFFDWSAIVDDQFTHSNAMASRELI